MNQFEIHSAFRLISLHSYLCLLYLKPVRTSDISVCTCTCISKRWQVCTLLLSSCVHCIILVSYTLLTHMTFLITSTPSPPPPPQKKKNESTGKTTKRRTSNSKFFSCGCDYPALVHTLVIFLMLTSTCTVSSYSCMLGNCFSLLCEPVLAVQYINVTYSSKFKPFYKDMIVQCINGFNFFSLK